MKKLLMFCFLLSVGMQLNSIDAQSRVEWKADLDILTVIIGKNHPMPWARISQIDFQQNVNNLKNSLNNWNDEKITLEVMKLLASLGDGHTYLKLDNLESFNLWFPVRIEEFNDGLFITGIDQKNSELVGAKVLKIGTHDADIAYQFVSEIISKDSQYGVRRSITNYLSNAVVLNELGITESRDLLPLEVEFADGRTKIIEMASKEWMLSFNWSYDKKVVPSSGETVTLFSGVNSLPEYLSEYIASPDNPFWFRLIPEDRMIYFQLNKVFDSNDESLSSFTGKVLSFYNDNASDVDKFVLDLRFNEGGDGEIVPAMVEQFRKYGDSFKDCRLYIVTGSNTFSAASILIGQMLKVTDVITVGEIAAGPLNFSSDPVMFVLPNSGLLVNVSRLYSQDGHPTDNRGFYTPDYFVPNRSTDYFSFTDPIMDLVRNGNVKSLKEVVLGEGSDQLKSEIEKRKESSGSVDGWFPYTSYDLALFVFNDLIPAEKYEEAVYISQLNIEVYPESIWGWFILGMISENMGMNSEALDCFNKILEIEPYHVESLWERDKLMAILNPVKLSSATLEDYAGEYSGRRILLEEGLLKYQVGDGKKKVLTPVSNTYFIIEDSNYRLTIVKEGERVDRIKIAKWEGSTNVYYNSGEE